MSRLNPVQLYIFFFLLITMSGCEFIGAVFEAGVWVGVIIVVLVIVFIIWLIGKFFR